MGRLIDEDKLMKDIEESMITNNHEDGRLRVNHNSEHQHFMYIVAKQPTAYDVNMVVNQLEDAYGRIYVKDDVDLGTKRGLNTAITIVKGTVT